VDLRHPYLREQLIAYIGNKRALLPFLHGVFAGLPVEPRGARFLDPFAGSGAVARLARLMGYSVQANDWEPYARVINACHLCVGPAEAAGMFGGRGGLHAVLAELNALPAPREEDRYVSRHYAPRDTALADWRTERLFYTRENALAIDAMRARIEELCPGQAADPARAREKDVLLAPLLYQAATHTNTSGVFKACHRGFGGHGRDALGRIMAPIRLDAPVLVDSPAPCSMDCRDAAEFLRGRSAEVCYLDPPYAVHQYGSNYFMLNSIARWDRPPVSDARGPDGRLRSKAGIRADWTATRSAFCYRGTAAAALRGVVDAADCRWLVVSYSTDGLIGLEQLCDLLSEAGGLSVLSTGHVKYPGGKQSITRANRTLECALVVERGRGRTSVGAVRREVAAARVSQLMAGSFVPERVRERFPAVGDAILPMGASTPLAMRHFWRFAPGGAPTGFARPADADRFLADLAACAARDLREEIGVLAGIAASAPPPRDAQALAREILRLVNKLAHRKHGAAFREVVADLRALVASGVFDAVFAERLDAIAARAAARAGTAPPPAH
jgi:adenine-specific DNA-methyltransferase